jgi:hypothetical protein
MTSLVKIWAWRIFLTRIFRNSRTVYCRPVIAADNCGATAHYPCYHCCYSSRISIYLVLTDIIRSSPPPRSFHQQFLIWISFATVYSPCLFQAYLEYFHRVILCSIAYLEALISTHSFLSRLFRLQPQRQPLAWIASTSCSTSVL